MSECRHPECADLRVTRRQMRLETACHIANAKALRVAGAVKTALTALPGHSDEDRAVVEYLFGALDDAGWTFVPPAAPCNAPLSDAPQPAANGDSAAVLDA